MNSCKALVTLRSSAELNSHQTEEFNRLANLYSKASDFALDHWSHYVSQKYEDTYSELAETYVTAKFRQMVFSTHWETQDDRSVVFCALKDVLRRLKEHYHTNSQRPENPHQPNVVRVYRQFDIKVSKGYAQLPVIGRIKVGRFQFFCGKIICTGLEVDHNGNFQSLVLFMPPDFSPLTT